MKKLFNVLGIIAASAIAFTACQEASVEAPVTPNLVTVTFTAQTPGTKLAATEGETAASYAWTAEDAVNMRLYTVSGTTLSQVSNPTITLEGTDLNISATVAAGEYTFRAILASKWTGSGSPRLDKDQSPAANAFDPAAVIMFSDDKEVDVAASTDPVELTFNRKSIVNKMTLKGLAEGETIDKVVITSDKSIVGYINKDTKAVTLDNKVLTLSYKQAATVPASGQFDVYFTTLAVEDVTLTVDVTTDQNTYTKTFGGSNKINFVEGQYTRFGVTMPSGTPITPGPGPSTDDYSGTWALVGENTKDNVTSYYAARAFSSSNNNLKTATLTPNSEKYNCEFDDVLFTIAKVSEGENAGYYTIKDSNNAYLYAASGSSNYLKASSDLGGAAYYWSIAEDGNGAYSIIAKDESMRNTMRFNYNNNSPLFSCYASSTTTGTNVKLVPGSDVVIIAEPEPTELTTVTAATTWGATVFQKGIDKKGTGELTSDFIFENLGFVAGGGKFKFGADNSTPRIQLGGTGTPGTKASIQIKVGGSGTLSLKARGSGSDSDRKLMVAVGSEPVDSGNIVPSNSGDITAFNYSVTANEGDLVNIYSAKSGINIYEITWTPGGAAPAAYAFTTVAELNALATSSAAEKFGKLTNAVVSYVPATNTAIIKDDTGSIMYYKTSHGLKQGQTFSGDITVSVVLYNSLYTEITSMNAAFTGSGAVVAPEELALSELVGNFDKYQNAYVKVSDLEVISVSGKNIDVQNGSSNYVVYSQAGNATCEAGDVLTVTGTVTKYGSTEEIKAWTFDDMVVTNRTEIKVTSDNPLAVANTGGSQTITYTINNPSSATLTASENADWISNLDYSTSGKVTFDVAAQQDGAAARSAVITLSYSGASDVEVTVNQAAGAGSSSNVIEVVWTRSGTTDTITSGYQINIPNNKPESKTDYYQDAGTAGSTVCAMVFQTEGRSTAMFSSTPSSITLSAKLGAGSVKDPLGNNVMACLVDSDGNDIASTVVTVTSKITNKTGSDFEVSIPVTGVTSAYGVKIYHTKESSWNVRYYGMTLTVQL